jgi:hypothetical protein
LGLVKGEGRVAEQVTVREITIKFEEGSRLQRILRPKEASRLRLRRMQVSFLLPAPGVVAAPAPGITV